MPEPTYGEIVNRMPSELAQRLPVQPGAHQEIHVHHHYAPEAVPDRDPAKRSTRDDGVLNWFVPYFVVAILSLIVVGGAVGMVMALAVVFLGMVVTLVNALMGMLMTVAVAAVCVILAMGEIKGKVKGKK